MDRPIRIQVGAKTFHLTAAQLLQVLNVAENGSSEYYIDCNGNDQGQGGARAQAIYNRGYDALIAVYRAAKEKL